MIHLPVACVVDAGATGDILIHRHGSGALAQPTSR
jgi:hypothetical protein